jgi:hypothetical protein
VRKILVDDPEFIFPLSLQQITLYRSMQGVTEKHIAKEKKRMNASLSPPFRKFQTDAFTSGFLDYPLHNICMAISA